MDDIKADQKDKPMILTNPIVVANPNRCMHNKIEKI